MRFHHLIMSAALALPNLAGATDQYASTIDAAALEFMPAPYSESASVLRAVLMTESAMRTDAVSAAGAQGIAQFMPATWAEVAIRLGDPEASPFIPGAAIRGAAFYIHSLYTQWTAKRPDRDRWSLALASYNAGLARVLRAQAKCAPCVAYADIALGLPAETTAYVRKVWGYHDAR